MYIYSKLTHHSRIRLIFLYIVLLIGQIILTWYGRHHDPQGGPPRARPFHCTPVGLTPAITPNVGDSST